MSTPEKILVSALVGDLVTPRHWLLCLSGNACTRAAMLSLESTNFRSPLTRLVRSLVLIVALVALESPAGASTITIDTGPGAVAYGVFGEGFTPVFGQSFTAPLAQLDSFTFFIDTLIGAPMFTAHVSQWNGIVPGPTLYTSSTLLAPTDPVDFTAGNFNPITVNTGGLSLLPGAQYVAYFAIVADGNLDRFHTLIFPTSDPYSGGHGIFFDGNASNTWGLSGDIAFNMQFSDGSATPVPEPGTMILFSTGIAVALRKRIWRRATERYQSLSG